MASQYKLVGLFRHYIFYSSHGFTVSPLSYNPSQINHTTEKCHGVHIVVQEHNRKEGCCQAAYAEVLLVTPSARILERRKPKHAANV